MLTAWKVTMMRDYRGRLNYNDCLVLLGCRELWLNAIVSFDPDFDYIDWIHRISDPDSALISQSPVS